MKILVVDDSVVYRGVVKALMQEIVGNSNVQTANNGQQALDLLAQTQFDLITLDMEMPVMDGLEAVKQIRGKKLTVPIIVFASATTSGAGKAMEALAAGANEFVKKFEGAIHQTFGINSIKEDLVPKIVSYLNMRPVSTLAQPASSPATTKDTGSWRKRLENVNLICIGSSTGGPDAHRKIFSLLRTKPHVPVLMVQHMPPVFTKQFAMMLSKVSQLDVREAVEGEEVRPGQFYLAPGDHHMIVKKSGVARLNIHLTQTEKVCSVRPAYDVLLDSVAPLTGFNVLGITLTGMGEDGMAGTARLKNPNSVIAIQNKESSVVWGMPGAIANKNLQDVTCGLEEIANLISTAGEKK